MAQGITPPPSVLPVQIQGVSAYGTTGNATSIPPAIAVLPTGTLLRGMITGRNAQGQIVLHTEKGDIALKTDIFFRRGVELMIRMEKMHDETTARIITVDGRSLAKYIESGGGTPPPEEDAIVHTPLMRQSGNAVPKEAAEAKDAKAPLMPPAPAALTPSGNTPVSARMTAILLTNLPPQNLAQNATPLIPEQVALLLQKAQAGTQLAVKITQLTLPPPTPASSATPAPLPAANMAVPPAVTPPAAPYPAGTPLPPTGSLAGAIPTATPQSAAPPAPTLAPTSFALNIPIPPSSAMPASPPQPFTATPPSHSNVLSNLAPLPSAPTATMPAPALGTVYTANEFSALPTPAASSPVPVTPMPAPAASAGMPSPSPLPASAPPPSPVAATTVTNAAPTLPVTTAATAAPPEAPPVPITVTTASTPAAPAPPLTATPAPLPPTITTSGAPSSSVQVVPSPAQAPAAAPLATSAPTAAPPATHAAPLPVSPSTTVPAPSPTVLTATVLEGSVESGLTLHSPIGTLRLFSPTPLPAGTQIQFEVEYALPPTASPHATSAGTQGSGTAASSLEALTNLPLPLIGLIPEAMLLRPHILPKPGREMTTEIMFLMSAIKGGDIRKWLGEDTIRRMEATQGEALKRIAAEFGMMRQSLGEEGDPVRWTMYQLPFATAIGIEPLRIYHRDTREKDAKESKKKGESGEHFIVDVMFTRIGTLQLDGFVKKSPTRNSFDLVVRSENPLEEPLKQGIREIFMEAGEITGYEGGISFREGKEALFLLPRAADTQLADPSGQSIVV